MSRENVLNAGKSHEALTGCWFALKLIHTPHQTQP